MKKKTALLALGLVASLGGVATAGAWLYGEAAKTSTSGALDAGLILDWGTSTLDENITNLSPGTIYTDDLTISAQKSATVGGYAILTFALSGDSAESIQVDIKEDEAFVQDDTDIQSITGTDSYSYSLKLGNAEGEWDGTAKQYFVRYTALASALAGEGTGNLSAKLTVSLTYSATAAVNE